MADIPDHDPRIAGQRRRGLDALAPASAPLAEADAACREIVRRHDPDRYVATLFGPAAAQEPLFALYAFSSEIARIREQIHEPMPGEIRHQWWREALSCRDLDGSRTNPVVRALRATMQRYNLPPEPFLGLIEARAFDLYDDPMPTWIDLEAYCGETASTLIRLATIVLADGKDPGSAALCGHAGVVQALTGLLRAFPIHARRQQCYLPHEVLIAAGVSLEDIYAGRDGEPLRAALAAVRQRAREHLAALRAGIAGIDPVIAPALYVVSLSERYLDRMERPDYQPFETLVQLSPLRRMFIIGRTRWQAVRAAKRAAAKQG